MNIFQSFNYFFKQQFLTATLATSATLALGTIAMANPAQPAQKIVAEPIKITSIQTKQNHPSNSQVLRFDIAEDATRFVFDDAPLLSNGFPAYGNSFVTQGYIYPAGTLNGSNGVNPDGSPEFPALVQGRWVCRGWFINPEGAAAASGEFVLWKQPVVTLLT